MHSRSNGCACHNQICTQSHFHSTCFLRQHMHSRSNGCACHNQICTQSHFHSTCFLRQHMHSRSNGCACHNQICTQSHLHNTCSLWPRKCHRNIWNQLHTRTHLHSCFCMSYASLILWPCTQYPSKLGTTHSEDRPCSTCCQHRNMRFHSNHHLHHRMQSSPRGC